MFLESWERVCDGVEGLHHTIRMDETDADAEYLAAMDWRSGILCSE